MRNLFSKEEKDMLYKYETHLHTKEASACARASGRDMAYAAKENGYAGIIVTDHNWGGNTCVDKNLPWADFVEQFCKGYEVALEAGREIDLDVFYGWEAGYNGTEFLIYGLDKQWMLDHPEIRDASVQEQFELVDKSGGLVIHAHPYREEWYIPQIRLYPEYVHGVEAINATHSHPRSVSHNDPTYNPLAIEYARKHHFPMTAGSDIHGTDMFGGGMCFARRLKDIHDFVRTVKAQECVLLTDGVEDFDYASLRA